MKKLLSKFIRFVFGERILFCHFTKILIAVFVLTSARQSYLEDWASPGGFNEDRAISFEGRLSEPQWLPPGKITVVSQIGPIGSATLEVSGTPTVKVKGREDFVSTSAGADEVLAGFTSDLRVKFLAKRGNVWFDYSEPVKLPDHPHDLISPAQSTLRHEGNLTVSCEQEKLTGLLLARELATAVGSGMLAVMWGFLAALVFGVSEHLIRQAASLRKRPAATGNA